GRFDRKGALVQFVENALELWGGEWQRGLLALVGSGTAKTKHRKSRRPEAGVTPGGCSGGAQTVARRPASWVISALFALSGTRVGGEPAARPDVLESGRAVRPGGGIVSSWCYIIFARVCSVS